MTFRHAPADSIRKKALEDPRRNMTTLKRPAGHHYYQGLDVTATTAIDASDEHTKRTRWMSADTFVAAKADFESNPSGAFFYGHVGSMDRSPTQFPQYNSQQQHQQLQVQQQHQQHEHQHQTFGIIGEAYQHSYTQHYGSYNTHQHQPHHPTSFNHNNNIAPYSSSIFRENVHNSDNYVSAGTFCGNGYASSFGATKSSPYLDYQSSQAPTTDNGVGQQQQSHFNEDLAARYQSNETFNYDIPPPTTATTTSNTTQKIISNNTETDEQKRLLLQVFLLNQQQKPNGKTAVASPVSKEYTILQPAGHDSRAATVLQDIAREGGCKTSAVHEAAPDASHSAAPTTSTTPQRPAAAAPISSDIPPAHHISGNVAYYGQNVYGLQRDADAPQFATQPIKTECPIKPEPRQGGDVMATTLDHYNSAPFECLPSHAYNTASNFTNSVFPVVPNVDVGPYPDYVKPEQQPAPLAQPQQQQLPTTIDYQSTVTPPSLQEHTTPLSDSISQPSQNYPQIVTAQIVQRQTAENAEQPNAAQSAGTFSRDSSPAGSASSQYLDNYHGFSPPISASRSPANRAVANDHGQQLQKQQLQQQQTLTRNQDPQDGRNYISPHLPCAASPPSNSIVRQTEQSPQSQSNHQYLHQQHQQQQQPQHQPQHPHSLCTSSVVSPLYGGPYAQHHPHHVVYPMPQSLLDKVLARKER